MIWWPIPLMILDCLIAAHASLQLKIGAERLQFNIGHILRNKALIKGITLFVTGVGVYFILLRFYQLSVLYALGSLTYVWSAFLAKKHLGEVIGPQKKIGIALIVLGVSIVGIVG